MDNKTIKNIGWIVMVALALAAIAYYSVVYYRQIKTSKYIASVEVREYQGKDLSSINDFRENSIKGPQHVDKDSYRLQLTGLVDNPQELTYDQVVNNYPSYKKVVTLNCVEGWSVNILWEGLLLKDMFAGLKIKPEAKTVIFYAVDGYSTSFPLSYLIDNNILLADKMNGVVLPAERGFPFMLVAESKWGYKWIKWINKIEFSADTDYQGYWESRGYSDTGDLDKSFAK